jgi:hypothetical protein
MTTRTTVIIGDRYFRLIPYPSVLAGWKVRVLELTSGKAKPLWFTQPWMALDRAMAEAYDRLRYEVG